MSNFDLWGHKSYILSYKNNNHATLKYIVTKKLVKLLKSRIAVIRCSAPIGNGRIVSLVNTFYIRGILLCRLPLGDLHIVFDPTFRILNISLFVCLLRCVFLFLQVLWKLIIGRSASSFCSKSVVIYQQLWSFSPI